jgi:hypothetical protein
LILHLIHLVAMSALFQLMHEHLKGRPARLIPQRSEYLSHHLQTFFLLHKTEDFRPK